MAMEKSNPFGEMAHGDLCPGMESLYINDYGYSGEMGMAKSQGDVCPGIENLQIHDHPATWRLIDSGEGPPDQEARFRALLAEERHAGYWKALVMELFYIDPDNYGFILDDYMMRALDPLRGFFIHLLNKFDIWPYEVVPSVYVEMRIARMFLIVMFPEFEEMFELAQDLFYHRYRCNEVHIDEIKTKTAELRRLIKSWVDTTNW